MQDREGIVDMLMIAMNDSTEDQLKNKASHDSIANSATTKARTVAFASAIAELVVAESDPDDIP